VNGCISRVAHTLHARTVLTLRLIRRRCFWTSRSGRWTQYSHLCRLGVVCHENRRSKRRRSFEVGNQVLLSSDRKLLLSKAMVVNVTNQQNHYVSPYTTNGGTTVQGHYQTNSNDTQLDNYGTRGNWCARRQLHGVAPVTRVTPVTATSVIIPG
jgi:hypothetical protein